MYLPKDIIPLICQYLGNDIICDFSLENTIYTTLLDKFDIDDLIANPEIPPSFIINRCLTHRNFRCRGSVYDRSDINTSTLINIFKPDIDTPLRCTLLDCQRFVDKVIDDIKQESFMNRILKRFKSYYSIPNMMRYNEYILIPRWDKILSKCILSYEFLDRYNHDFSFVCSNVNVPVKYLEDNLHRLNHSHYCILAANSGLPVSFFVKHISKFTGQAWAILHENINVPMDVFALRSKEIIWTKLSQHPLATSEFFQRYGKLTPFIKYSIDKCKESRSSEQSIKLISLDHDIKSLTSDKNLPKMYKLNHIKDFLTKLLC